MLWIIKGGLGALYLLMAALALAALAVCIVNRDLIDCAVAGGEFVIGGIYGIILLKDGRRDFRTWIAGRPRLRDWAERFTGRFQ